MQILSLTPVFNKTFGTHSPMFWLFFSILRHPSELPTNLSLYHWNWRPVTCASVYIVYSCMRSCTCHKEDLDKVKSAWYVWRQSMMSCLVFVLYRDNNQVAVYSINDYQLLRHDLKLPAHPQVALHVYNDMTSCVRHKMSDFGNSCIHRYDIHEHSEEACGFSH